MLLEEFDKEKTAVINADMFHEKTADFPKTCMSFFSKSILAEFVEKFNPDIIGEVSNSTAIFPIYKIVVDGVALVVTQAPVGAPACVANFEEIISMGVRNIMLFGCCGCLDNSLDDYSIIIPTSAIRDEGTSYHYLEVSDEVEIDSECIRVVEDVINELGLKYSKGKAWTTDAIFRETRSKVERRKNQGAITVDMECSAMAALCKFRQVNFAQFFYAADNLSNEEYDPRSLIGGDLSEKAKMLPIGIKCAIEMNKRFN